MKICIYYNLPLPIFYFMCYLITLFRHVGDLGNVVVRPTADGGAGIVSTTFTDSIIDLNGDNSIVGKVIVVHAGKDDLGEVDNDGSRATGNAGGRLGCCKIMEDSASDDLSLTSPEPESEATEGPAGSGMVALLSTMLLAMNIVIHLL